MAEFDAETFLATLATRPGVYRMVGDGDEVLYVGKARNLKARVTSYFRASGLDAKTMALVSRVRDIRVTVTGSETEALLLEQSFIKAERPRFNVLLRDDKSFPFIHLSAHPYPRLAMHRGAKRSGRYFGPYTSSVAVRDSIQILQKLFRIRPCTDSFFKNRSRPCLQHQIGRCSAPCVGRIDEASYAEDVRLATLFLDGRSDDVLREFKAKMHAAAQALEFETAARYRDQVHHLQRVQESQHVHGDGGDADVFAAAVGGGRACVHGLFVRDGRLLGHRSWFPKDELAKDEDELLAAFLGQYYLAGGEREIPKAVLTATPLADADVLAAALAERAGRKVQVARPARGQRTRWAAMARDNADLSLQALLAERKSIAARFVDLQAALGWEQPPRRLECFDISHSSGEAPVASCVVFDADGPVKSDYRRFNIEGVTPGDDYAAIAQGIRRRYSKLAAGDGALPDAVVVDGGAGQLRSAEEVLQELQVNGVALLGIAKGPTRKPGLETVLLSGRGELHLPATGAAMHLLQHIRDEAHRFAIAGHRARRRKKRRRSVLDDIPGVGPRRKRALLAHFGSVAAIDGASAEEIAKVPGVNRKLAADIHGAFHGG